MKWGLWTLLLTNAFLVGVISWAVTRWCVDNGGDCPTKVETLSDMTAHREGILSSYFAVAVALFLAEVGHVSIELLRMEVVRSLVEKIGLGAVTVCTVFAGVLTVATPIDLEPTLHRVFAGTFFGFSLVLLSWWARIHMDAARSTVGTVLVMIEVAVILAGAVLVILFMASVLDDFAEFLFFLCVQIDSLLLAHALCVDDGFGPLY